MLLKKKNVESTKNFPKSKKKKKFKLPTAFTILFFIIVFLVLLTWILHWAGVSTDVTKQAVDEFGHPKWDENGAPVVETLRQGIAGMGIIDIFYSIIQGFISRGSIIIFIIALGAYVFVLLQSKALESLTQGIARKLQTKAIWIVPILVIFFSFCGTTHGMCEESLGFYPLILPLMLSAGFDVATGFLTIFVGAGTGVLASTINPFVISVAIEAANGGANGEIIPASEGMAFRWIAWVIFTIVAVVFVTIYANKVLKNPTKSVTFKTLEGDKKFFLGGTQEKIQMTRKRIYINIIFFITFIAMILYLVGWDDILGGTKFKDAGDWVNNNLYFLTGVMPGLGKGGLLEVSAFFLFASLITAFFNWKGEKTYTDDMVEGGKGMLGVCLVISTAAGIGFILENSHLQELFVNGLKDSVGQVTNTQGFMLISFILFAPLSFFIPSTSGFATAIFPIWAPVAVGANAGMGSVMSFAFSSGIVNMITPTSGVVVATLALSRMKYEQLTKIIWPYLLICTVISIVLLGVGPFMGPTIFGQ